MGLLDFGAKVAQEISNVHSRAFFEAVNPAYDVYKKGDDVFVDVDLPGYTIKQIKYDIEGGPKILGTQFKSAILHIEASRKEIDKDNYDILVSTRPVNIHATLPLPIRITEHEVKVTWAKYLISERGVVRICLRLPPRDDTHEPIQDEDVDDVKSHSEELE